MKIAHSTIDSHLEKGLENIYTVFGNETLFIQETIEKIRAKAVTNGYTERSSIVVTKDFDWTTLTNASENLDLFGNMKILELGQASERLFIMLFRWVKKSISLKAQ